MKEVTCKQTLEEVKSYGSPVEASQTAEEQVQRPSCKCAESREREEDNGVKEVTGYLLTGVFIRKEKSN